MAAASMPGALLITGTRLFENTAYDGSALEITGTAQARLVNAFIADNPANGAFPSTNASVRFDSSGDSVVLHTTFGNATQVLTRALSVNSGVVTVANTIVASYTTGLSQFGGYLSRRLQPVLQHAAHVHRIDQQRRPQSDWSRSVVQESA